MNHLVRGGALGALTLSLLGLTSSPASADGYSLNAFTPRDAPPFILGTNMQLSGNFGFKIWDPAQPSPPCFSAPVSPVAVALSGNPVNIITGLTATPTISTPSGGNTGPIDGDPGRQPPVNGGQTPEPASLLLLGLGGLGAVTRLRKRAA